MYKIEQRSSGFVLTFGGTIPIEEMQQWVIESRKILDGAPVHFGVIVDMRTLAPLKGDAQAEMVKGQQLYKAKGMTRSAVVVNNAITAAQFKRLAKESGIYAWERYIDGQAVADWSSVAVAWVKDGVDPDS